MPKRKLARRFEPRYGLSQTVVAAESKYIARELEDYLLQSTEELRGLIFIFHSVVDGRTRTILPRRTFQGLRPGVWP